MRRSRWALISTFAVLLQAGCAEEAAAPALLEIPYITAQAQDVTIPLDIVGETIGSTDVTIRARVDGFLDGIHFTEGSFVAEGDLLYTIDPQPFEAKLAQAQATLAQAQTALVKSQSDLERIRPLAEMKAVSAQDLDAAVANHKASLSYIDATNAQVDLAELELSYTRIISPVGGLIGITELQVGDFISQQNNGGLLNVVSRTDPIGVRASIPEALYLTIARRLVVDGSTAAERQARRDALDAPLTLLLADSSTYEHRGRPTKIDRNIDASTGTLTIEAEFPNPNDLLRPGMFSRIRFDAAELDDAILVPQRAVNELQSAYRIFVILPDDSIDVRQVEVGQKLGSNWIITSGITPGDRIAVEGLLRLQPGMVVKPRAAQAADLPVAASALSARED